MAEALGGLPPLQAVHRLQIPGIGNGTLSPGDCSGCDASLRSLWLAERHRWIILSTRRRVELLDRAWWSRMTRSSASISRRRCGASASARACRIHGGGGAVDHRQCRDPLCRARLQCRPRQHRGHGGSAGGARRSGPLPHRLWHLRRAAAEPLPTSRCSSKPFSTDLLAAAMLKELDELEPQAGRFAKAPAASSLCRRQCLSRPGDADAEIRRQSVHDVQRMGLPRPLRGGGGATASPPSNSCFPMPTRRTRSPRRSRPRGSPRRCSTCRPATGTRASAAWPASPAARRSSAPPSRPRCPMPRRRV